MEYHVIIPAAGQGTRMKAGKNKQFILLNDKPVIIHTLSIFEKADNCAGVIIVCNKAEKQQIQDLIIEYNITKVKAIVSGGKERQNSVWNGLKALQDITNSTLVLVHDGARPFVTQSMLNNLVQVAERNGAATVAVPVKDTIKRVKDHAVIETLERSSLWAIQTPQAFHMPLLFSAHQQAEDTNYVGTDDASLVEKLGQAVKIVEGDYRNIKLTTPEDMLYANAILAEW
ncbi:2-C-methyl-D-erythritol 4-phosphate cytidylyltransferase [Bacillus sp. HMF5848]|uniref:2-C-methyl-D-erythritol 4-phosphate cytidylyltransferase n=1 Tax=Bacillus sp. HMF5848 TaxID=2495421 RepID=UPI000F779D32|nr:2-C-methyl-D-erythritol 4-phosphate cytidylyltransferase [Bacillus sp. HMF5848]RSK25522.1 2-C-methyl-D-erythritol 4-phosphate cytidylyltransferase [Bacillus sp. HMF5848]